MDNLEQKLTALASEIGVSKSIDILSAMRASILATMQGGFKSDPLPPTPSKMANHCHGIVKSTGEHCSCPAASGEKFCHRHKHLA